MNEDDDTEEDDWQDYADSGFGSTDLDLWGDLTIVEKKSEDELEQLPEQLDTHLQEIPPAPSPAGLKHLVRIGCCDHCLGRLGGRSTIGQRLMDVGSEIRSLVEERDSNMAGVRELESWCPFCENLFEEANLLAKVMHRELAGYECDRLQLGAQFPRDQTESEDHLRKRFGAAGSAPLKSSLMESVAKCLRELDPSIKLVNERPQILALIDLLTLNVSLDVRSHHMYARYRKLKRGIPQTRWPCRTCKGRGCKKCSGTGQQYEHSVQALVGDPLLPIFEAEDHSFHGMGREDIDVRCLGRGRPFVIELKKPRKRNIDLEKAMVSINEAADGAIEILGLRSSQRSEVVRVKETPAEKSYRIGFRMYPSRQDEEVDLQALKKSELEKLCNERGLTKSGTKAVLIERLNTTDELPDEEKIFEVLRGMEGITIAQRTPKRVAHRRADKIRKRKVIEVSEISVNKVDGELEVEVNLRCESGTYVKETVHGDEGRTEPSIAGLLNARCEVQWLDVADIHAD